MARATPFQAEKHAAYLRHLLRRGEVLAFDARGAAAHEEDEDAGE